MINDIKRDVSNGYIDVSNRYMDVSNGKVLEEPSNYPSNYPIKNKIINKIDKIVNSKEIDKQTKIVELASVPLMELKQSLSKHPYYIRQAIEHQEQELRDKRSVPKNILDQRLSSALQTNAKNRSAAYKAKVAYNKANNIKPWEIKKNKF
jgi:hypothetical protein